MKTRKEAKAIEETILINNTKGAEKIKVLRGDHFRINDLIFEVPPTDISIIKQEYNKNIPGIRTGAASKIKSGRKTVSIIVNITFAAGYNANEDKSVTLVEWVNRQLSPLLIQVRKFPFVSIENEKIRKEMVGDKLATNKIDDNPYRLPVNMGAVVKSVSMDANSRSPEQINVEIVLEWFNYLPYSPDFRYKKYVKKDTGVSTLQIDAPTDLPDEPFRRFMNSGTLDNSGNYINNIRNLDNTLEIIYKEYDTIQTNENLSIEQIDQDREERTTRSNGEGYDLNVLLNSKTKEGWQYDKTINNNIKQGIILYRYRREVFDSRSPVLDSDKLIVESISAGIQTRTASIPLLAHTIPTAQYLGGTEGVISFNIFANAKLHETENGSVPVATSSELERLNNIFEQVSYNAVRYRSISRNDSILIKHPMAKLLRYSKYDDEDKKVKCYDVQKGIVNDFIYDEYLSCIVEKTSSETVPNLPYCSRFSFSVSENYISRKSSTESDDKVAGVYDASLSIISKLGKKYKIEKNKNGQFEILNKNIFDVDKDAAEKLVVRLNETLDFYRFDDIDEILNNPDMINDTLKSDDKKRIKVGKQGSEYGLFAVKTGYIKNRRPGVLGSGVGIKGSTLNEIVDLILKKIDESNNPDFVNYYRVEYDTFLNYGKVANDNNYPDLRLLDEDPLMEPDFFFYNRSETASNTEKKFKLLSKINERYAQTIQKYGEEALDEGAEKTVNEIVGNVQGPKRRLAAAMNANVKPSKKRIIDISDEDKGFAQVPDDPEQMAATIQSCVDNFVDETYLMRRSMPTFRLYIKEPDVESLSDISRSRRERKGSPWRNFSDFYSLNSIIDIRTIKTEDNPAKIMVVRIANLKEDLVNKKFDSEFRIDRRGNKADAHNKDSETLKTNVKPRKVDELDGVMLREGVRIELRMGYTADPNKLPVEFSGRILEVGGGDILEVVCQGDGIELMQEIKGAASKTGNEGDEYSFHSNTPNLIEEILGTSDEVKSFGTVGSKSSLGQIKRLWRIAGGRSIVENIFAPSLFSTWSNFASVAGKVGSWGATFTAAFSSFVGTTTIVTQTAIISTIAGLTVGQIVGAAIGVALLVGSIDALDNFLNGSPFVVYEQTIWDILQELTLRHPGTICDVVPFDRRSTIFFGYPNLLYFHRGPTYTEAGKIDLQGSLLENNLKEQIIKDSKTIKGANDRYQLGGPNTAYYNERSKKKYTDQIIDKAISNNAILLSLMKPYQNYHMITSEHDIIENGMIASSQDVYNAVEVIHPEKSGDIEVAGREYDDYVSSETIQADDDLEKDYIRKKTVVYHNAHKSVVKDLPEIYAISTLCKSLEKIYKGKIKIIGRPNVKPHDILFIYDSYNRIVGPVKVGEVVQHISLETGWITEITPRMIVHPTTSSIIPQINALKKLVLSFYLENIKIFYSSGTSMNVQPDHRTKAEMFKDHIMPLAGGALMVVGGFSLANSIETGIKIFDGKIEKGALAKSLAKFRGAESAAGKVFSGAGVGLSTAGFSVLSFIRAAFPLVLTIGIDYALGWYTNWSKFREPVSFIPVTRNNRPWYTSLYGLKNTTETDAIKKIGSDISRTAEDVYDVLKDEFPDIL